MGFVGFGVFWVVKDLGGFEDIGVWAVLGVKTCWAYACISVPKVGKLLVHVFLIPESLKHIEISR